MGLWRELVCSIFICSLEQGLNFEINYKQLVLKVLYMLFKNEFEYLVYLKSDFECVLGRLSVLEFCLLSLCQLLENPSSSLHLFKSKRAAIQDSRH